MTIAPVRFHCNGLPDFSNEDSLMRIHSSVFSSCPHCFRETMRIRAYLHVVSDEATIRSIHNETSLSEANIKELKAPRGISGDMWWRWQTAYIPLDIDDPDAGLKALLSKYKPIFPIIRKYRGPDVDVYLQMVTSYEENEDPRVCLSQRKQLHY